MDDIKSSVDKQLNIEVFFSAIYFRFSMPSADLRRAVASYWHKYVHEVLVNRLGGISLSRKSVVKLTDCPDMTLAVYRGRKPRKQQQQTRIPRNAMSHLLFAFTLGTQLKHQYDTYFGKIHWVVHEILSVLYFRYFK